MTLIQKKRCRELIFLGKRVELYNLKTDPSEKDNLSEKMPEKTQELIENLKSWWKKTGARLPVKNPDADVEHWSNTAHNKQR